MGHGRVAGLRKRGRSDRKVRAIGRLIFEEYQRLPDGSCGQLTRRKEIDNTILSFTTLIQLVAGTSDAHLSASFTGIRFSSTSGGATVYSDVGVDAGPSVVAAVNTDGRRVRWSFHDDTATARTGLNWAELWNGDPATPTGSAEDGGNAVAISRVNCALGDKPTDKNWRYHYEIELYSADADIETRLNSSWMDLITGAIANHLTTANVRIQPKDGANAAVGAAILAGSRSVGSNYLEFVFTSADGGNNGAWANVAVQNNTGTWGDMRYGGCKQDGSSCGTKAAGEEWTWTWRYTLS